MLRKFRRLFLLTSILLLLWSWLNRKRTKQAESTQKGPMEIEMPLQALEDFVPGKLSGRIADKPIDTDEKLRKTEKIPAPKHTIEKDHDDLKRIEGIGPKISQALNQAGILTYAQLAELSTEEIRAILTTGGIRIAQVDTWPEQAQLAAQSDWDGLKSLQSQLKAGRRN